MTYDELCVSVAGRVSAMTGIAIDAIDFDTELVSYGLDSAAAVELVAELEVDLGHQLDPRLLWDFPTIRALATELAAKET